MRSVFDASNGVEAHMINNLLGFNNLTGEVFGEHLQGGVGDLQAVGIVRVMVSDEDYDEARRIISEWESSQSTPEDADDKTVKKYGVFSGGLIGFILGVVTVLLLFQSTVEYDGVDHDGDGVLDEKWKYMNYLLASGELDQNRDGEVDLTYKYDLKGIISTSTLDSDFDGRHETRCVYEQGNIHSCNIDLDDDGFHEIRQNYKHGIIETVFMFDPRSKLIKKKQFFERQQLKSSDIDLDGDGLLETHFEYDEFEQEKN